jgi:hypothetical protein
LRATDFWFLDFQNDLVDGLGCIKRQNQRLLTLLICHPTTFPRPASLIKDILDGMRVILRSYLHCGSGRNVNFPRLENRVT